MDETAITVNDAGGRRWWQRPLSPGEHRRIRRHLVLLPAYVWLFYAWWATLTHLPLASATPIRVRDFVHFYVQGAIAREGNAAALYDAPAMAAMVPRLVPGAEAITYPPVYGPQVSVFFSPLARLPYNTALYVWMAITIVVFLACGWATLSICPRLRPWRWSVLLLLLAAPALHLTIGFSQASAIGLACVTVAALALDARRPFLAGLAIGGLAYKPPLGIAAAFVFLFAREWRIVAGAALSSAAQLAAGCLFWGPGILVPYAAAIGRVPEVADAMEPYRYQMHSWRAFFQLLGLPEAVAFPAYVLAALVTLVGALRVWQSRAPVAIRYGVLLLATVLVDPHLYVYDLLLLLPALLLLWDHVESRPESRVRWQMRAALAFVYFLPLLGPLSSVVRVQVSVLGMALLAVLAARGAPRPREVCVTQDTNVHLRDTHI